MSDYDNTNSGALFKNEDKKSDKHPDYRGQLDVEGEEYWVSAWIRTSKAGKKYMSLSIQAKEEQTRESTPARTNRNEDFDDDIPF
jgi:uncharacterized protein (DUF736 family)